MKIALGITIFVKKYGYNYSIVTTSDPIKTRESETWRQATTMFAAMLAPPSIATSSVHLAFKHLCMRTSLSPHLLSISPPPKIKPSFAIARKKFQSWSKMSNEVSEDGLRKPLLHTGSWYRMSGLRQSSVMSSSAQILRESISVYFCVLIVALGPIQFGYTVIHPSLPYTLLPSFNLYSCQCLCRLIVWKKTVFHLLNILFAIMWQCGFSNPTQSEIISDLGLTISEV